MAEAIMQDLLLLDDILVESKGLIVLFPEPVSDMTTRILEKRPDAVNLYTLGEYIGARQDVPDPYGGSEDDYEQCYDQLRGMLLTLAEIIKEEDT